MTQRDSSEEEIDLGTVYGSLRQGYHNLLIYFYRGIRFLMRTWIWIFALLIIGFGLGFYLDSQETKVGKAELIVQLNFDSANYIYNQIDQLDALIEEKDLNYLEKNGLVVDGSSLIKKIEIEPIVNLDDIIPKEGFVNHGYVQEIFDKSKFEDDLLTSDILIQKYKYHKITVKATELKNENVFNILLTYLNNNTLINEIKSVKVESTKNIIEKNEHSIASIDSIAKTYGQFKPDNKSAEQIYFNFNDQSLPNIHLLFEEKSALLKENEDLQIELLKYDDIVRLLNKPQLHIEQGSLKKMSIVLPVIFFFGFIFLAVFVKTYYKAKRLEAKRT